MKLKKKYLDSFLIGLQEEYNSLVEQLKKLKTYKKILI